MNLHYRKYGQGPPLIVIHGLYGASDNWIKIARALESRFEIYLPDQRNHGRSPHADSNLYEDMRQDLFEFMAQHDIASAVLMGHSMGGKTAMSFAAMYPEKLNGLIVVDIAPKSYLDVSKTLRKTIDHQTIIAAMASVDFSTVTSRAGVSDALARYIDSDRVRLFLMKNLRRNPDQSFRWGLNADALEAHLGHILDCVVCSDFEAGKAITGFPVLFVRGALSNYILDEDLPSIKSIFPYAEFVTIPDAGHWLHVEQPELLVRAIEEGILEG